METREDNPSVVHGIDPGECRARVLKNLDWIECLEKGAVHCTHSLFFGSGFLCRHPDQKRSLSRARLSSVVGEGIEPSRAMPVDLQIPTL